MGRMTHQALSLPNAAVCGLLGGWIRFGGGAPIPDERKYL
jgi:hypothetical protein